MKGHAQTANTTQALTKHRRIETKLCPNLVPKQIVTVLKCQPIITAVVSLSTQYLDHANPSRNEKELINVGIVTSKDSTQNAMTRLQTVRRKWKFTFGRIMSIWPGPTTSMQAGSKESWSKLSFSPFHLLQKRVAGCHGRGCAIVNCRFLESNWWWYLKPVKTLQKHRTSTLGFATVKRQPHK